MILHPKSKVMFAVLSFLSCVNTEKAFAADADQNQGFFPLMPRFSVLGGIGNNNFVNGELMAPLYGSSDNILYADINAQTGKNHAQFASLGLGVRAALNDDLLWGGYIFGERIRSGTQYGDNRWRVINPGVEFMTTEWDGRVNAYIPMGKRQAITGNYFGDQLGVPNATTFRNHSQFSYIFDAIEEVGNGMDADAGYTFQSLNRLRVHGGGYYFNMHKTQNIKGAEIGAEMPINRYLSLKADDTYDNITHNTAVLSVRFTLGGTEKSNPVTSVEERMLDPIERHLGSLSSSSGLPVNHDIIQTKKIVVERDNIWFFRGDNSGSYFDAKAGATNCTFEHPCKPQDFTASNADSIAKISPNANFYLSPGVYFLNHPSTTVGFDLPKGQSIYGRNADYRLPANLGGEYPSLIGRINALGNNNLDSLGIYNNNATERVGIYILNTKNVYLNNLQVGKLNFPEGYELPIVLDKAQNVRLSHSTINAWAVGLTTNNDSTIEADYNVFNVASVPGAPPRVLKGVLNFYAKEINLLSNTFNINLTLPSTHPGDTGVYGIFEYIKSNTGTVINAKSNIFNESSTVTISQGEYLEAVYNPDANINLNSNVFNLKSTAQNNTLLGIDNGGATVNASGNTFNLENNLHGTTIGVNNRYGGTVHLQSNTFNLNSQGADSVTGVINTPAPGYPSPGITEGNNNIFNFTGTATTVTCGSVKGDKNKFNGCTNPPPV